MKVDLERVGAVDPERYKVKVREDDSGAVQDGTVIGLVTRTGDTSWGFAPRRGDDDTFDTSVSLTFTAKDAEELKAAIPSRFGMLGELPADRLLDDTLEQFAANMLTPISSLATHTSSIGGLVKALAHQVALIAAADVQEGKRDEFFSMFAERVREETADIVKVRDRNVAMRIMMSSLLKAKGADILTGLQGNDDDGPIKH